MVTKHNCVVPFTGIFIQHLHIYLDHEDVDEDVPELEEVFPDGVHVGRDAEPEVPGQRHHHRHHAAGLGQLGHQLLSSFAGHGVLGRGGEPLDIVYMVDIDI